MLTHDVLWAGAGLKIENAQFHLETMSRVLQRQSPEREIVVGGMGTVISGNLASGFLCPFRRVPVGIAERAGDHSMLLRRGHRRSDNEGIV